MWFILDVASEVVTPLRTNQLSGLMAPEMNPPQPLNLYAMAVSSGVFSFFSFLFFLSIAEVTSVLCGRVE